MASESFTDVPNDHWAAESVEAVADAGIMQGYPDSTFSGEKHVTRYELAVALANFVEYVRETQEPLVTSDTEISITPPQHWSKNSMDYLRNGGLVPEDSNLFEDGAALVTQDDLARALASVGARLIALRSDQPE